MDTRPEKGSGTRDSDTQKEISTRDSQTESSARDPQTESRARDPPHSLPVVDQKEVEQNDNIETYPKLHIRSEFEGFPVELGHDQTSNGDEISSKNSSFDHIEVDPEILNPRMTDDKSSEPIHPEETDESSRNGSFKINSGVISRNHSSEHLESQPETVDDGGGSHIEESQLTTLSQSEDQPTVEDNKPTSPIIKMGSSSSSSSSSESSSGKGPFPGDLNDDFDPRSPGEDKKLARDTISEQNKPEEAESSSVSPVVASPAGSEITLSGISPIQSPPVQVMQRSEGYDPNRIPQSIFQRSTSDAQNDWSIASNESLFSIHVGASTSFSREQAAFIKAEEVVPKQDEPFSFTPRKPSDETPESPTSPAAFPVSELAAADAVTASSPAVEPRKQNAGTKTEIISTTPVQYPSPESAKRAAAEERRSSNQKRAPIVSWRSNRNSNFSDRSQNSTKSFAFPILNDDARLESSSTPVNKEEQRQETGTSAAVVGPPPRKVKRRWYRFLYCCSWKGCCCCSCRCCSCPSFRCFRSSKCVRC